jgi:hypothetical protein
MPIPINDAAFEYLLARAGLTLTDAEKAELKTVCDHFIMGCPRPALPQKRVQGCIQRLGEIFTSSRFVRPRLMEKATR